MNHRREDTSGANTFNQVQTRICISKPFYVVTERTLRCTFDNSVSRKCSEIPSDRGGPSNRVTVERCFFPTLLFLSKKKICYLSTSLPNRTIYRETIGTRNNSQVRTKFARRDTIPLLRILLASFLYVPLAYAQTIENAFTSSRNPS